MSWPQDIIALLLALWTIGTMRGTYRDSSLSSGFVVAVWFAQIAIVVAVCYVLSAGGFW